MAFQRHVLNKFGLLDVSCSCVSCVPPPGLSAARHFCLASTVWHLLQRLRLIPAATGREADPAGQPPRPWCACTSAACRRTSRPSSWRRALRRSVAWRVPTWHCRRRPGRGRRRSPAAAASATWSWSRGMTRRCGAACPRYDLRLQSLQSQSLQSGPAPDVPTSPRCLPHGPRRQKVRERQAHAAALPAEQFVGQAPCCVAPRAAVVRPAELTAALSAEWRARSAARRSTCVPTIAAGSMRELRWAARRSPPGPRAQYNGCKWRGGVLRVERARPAFHLRLVREWAAEAEAARGAAQRGAAAAEAAAAALADARAKPPPKLSLAAPGSRKARAPQRRRRPPACWLQRYFALSRRPSLLWQRRASVPVLSTGSNASARACARESGWWRDVRGCRAVRSVCPAAASILRSACFRPTLLVPSVHSVHSGDGRGAA